MYPGGETVPEYAVVHRGEMDLSEHWGDVGHNLRQSHQRPRELVVKVKLGALKSAKGVDLDVTVRKVELGYTGKYKLDLTLPFDVYQDQGRARFDKATTTLEVTLPVVPPPKLKAAPAPSVVCEVVDVADRGGEPDVAPEVQAEPAEAEPTKVEEKVEEKEEEEEEGAGPPETSGGAAAEEEEETDAMKAWKELCAKRDAEERRNEQALEAKAAAAEAARQAEIEAQPDNPELDMGQFQAGDYVTCEAFKGHVKGFVFKRDDLGLGYYRDAPAAGGGREAAPPKPEPTQPATAAAPAPARAPKLEPRLVTDLIDELD